MPNAQSFMLKVKGDSMINAGIFDGDQVLVRQQSSASNGDIVVALVEDSATVKTFYKEDGYYRLQPENDSMEPILVHDNLKILGKVFGVFVYTNKNRSISDYFPIYSCFSPSMVYIFFLQLTYSKF